MSSRQIPARVVKELYAKSGNCCAFSGCNEQLFENANVGQICHIQGVNSGKTFPVCRTIEVRQTD